MTNPNQHTPSSTRKRKFQDTHTPSPVLTREKSRKTISCPAPKCSQVSLPPLDPTLPASEIHQIQLVVQKAKRGNAEMQFRLGKLFERGRAFPRDLHSAVFWWTQAAERNHVLASTYLGIVYRNGLGVKKDTKKAFEYYLKVAERGNPIIQYNVGVYYFCGVGVEKSEERAVHWFELSAEQGFAPALMNLAEYYYKGKWVEKNLKKAFELYKDASFQGLSVLHYTTEKSHRKFKTSILRAVRCYMHARGISLLRDENQYLEKALCAYKSVQGKYRYKQCWQYDKEETISNNLLHYTLLSTYFSYLNSSYYLGKLYLLGEGVSRNASKALNWYQIAANENFAPAQFDLGTFYWKGQGVRRDMLEALKWYLLSSNQGHPRAHYNLAVCYEMGRIVKKDVDRAIHLYTLAAPENPKAKSRLTMLLQNRGAVNGSTSIPTSNEKDSMHS